MITIKLLSTGYYRAQGNGPCEWAQWAKGRFRTVGDQFNDSSFFPQASDKFRQELATKIEKGLTEMAQGD